MSRLIVLMVFGMLSHIVRKLGPSIVLFVFVWAMHSQGIESLGGKVLGLPVHAVLAVTAILFGVLTMAIRDSVHGMAQRAHKRASPLLLGWVLREIDGSDFTIHNLQRLSNEISNGLQSLAVILLLVGIAGFTFPLFALVLALVAVIVACLSVIEGREVASTEPLSFLGRLKAHPDYYAEVLVVAGLIIAFLAVANEKSMVSGTVFIYFVSRFTNEFKVMAKTILAINRAKGNARRTWESRANRQAEALAKRQAQIEQAAKAGPAGPLTQTRPAA